MKEELRQKRSERILKFAQEKFLTEGFSNVTMDEIALGLGMGKGTLYQYFPSKEALMHGVIERMVGGIRAYLTALMEDPARSSVEQLQEFFRYVGIRLAAIPGFVITDLQRNAPDAYAGMTRMRQELIEDILANLIRSGIRDGLFRPETDAFILTQMVIGSITQLSGSSASALHSFSLEQLFHIVLGTLLNGCLTERGRTQLHS